MSDPTNRTPDDDDAATVPIDPDVTDDTSTVTTSSHKEETTHRVENDPDEGTYTDVDLPDDEAGSGIGTA
jgi:hypothetical protein